MIMANVCNTYFHLDKENKKLNGIIQSFRLANVKKVSLRFFVPILLFSVD